MSFITSQNFMYAFQFMAPICYAYHAYKNTHLEISLPIETITEDIDPITIGSEIITKSIQIISYPSGTPEYFEKIKTLQQSDLKTHLQGFLDAQGIRKDLIVLQRPEAKQGICAAFGTNDYIKGHAWVDVTPGFYDTDKDAYGFIMKHEIGHLKNNDTFNRQLVSVISALASIIFAMYMKVSIYRMGWLCFALNKIPITLYSLYMEGRADDFAIASSTNFELEGGRRMMKSVQQIFQIKRENYLKDNSIESKIQRAWCHFVYTEKGEFLLDIEHPSTASRLLKIEKELIARGEKLVDYNNLEGISSIIKLARIFE